MIVKHVHGFWGAVRCWLKPCAVAVELQRIRNREIAKRRVEAFVEKDRQDTERIRAWLREDEAEQW